MKVEHKHLCLAVLDTLKRLNPADDAYFAGPAIVTLDDDNSNASQSKYRELIQNPTDLGLIRLFNVVHHFYSSATSSPTCCFTIFSSFILH